MQTRPPLRELGLNSGKKARLHRILFDHGLRNGSAFFLPYDQGLEHGPRDFFANPQASDPAYIVKLAIAGGFNGIAVQIGLAEKFYWDYAGEIPLILKLNGKTDIPSDAEALSPVRRRPRADLRPQRLAATVRRIPALRGLPEGDPRGAPERVTDRGEIDEQSTDGVRRDDP